MKFLKHAITLLLLCLCALAASAPASEIAYFHNDLTGSPVVATDQAGRVLWRESYRPYGERLNNDPAGQDNKVWFASRHQDQDTGLVYMGARYYDPMIGRFLSVDSVRFTEGNVHSFNRYAYANNNPYKYRDPDGKEPLVAYDYFGNGGRVSSPMEEFRSYGEAMGRAIEQVGEWYLIGMSMVVPELGGTARVVGMAAKETTTVIGRVKDLKNLEAGEKSLLDRLPNLGDPKTNWQQNAGALREEMRRGLPIRDASPGDTAGQFLNAERNLLSDRGWTFDPKTNYWMPSSP